METIIVKDLETLSTVESMGTWESEDRSHDYWSFNGSTYRIGKNTRYKLTLIDDILGWQTRNQFTREELEKKPIRVLEIIYDGVE